MDYQKWVFMESWARPFALWLCSRGAGKTVEAAVFLQAKIESVTNSELLYNLNLCPAGSCINPVSEFPLWCW